MDGNGELPGESVYRGVRVRLLAALVAIGAGAAAVVIAILLVKSVLA